MKFFGFGKLTLTNADHHKIFKYYNDKKQQGKPYIAPQGIEMIVDGLRTTRVQSARPQSILVKTDWEDGSSIKTLEATVKIFKEGDFETVLDEVVWWAGQAESQGTRIIIDDKYEDGVLVFWGSKFAFLITKLSERKFLLYGSKT